MAFVVAIAGIMFPAISVHGQLNVYTRVEVPMYVWYRILTWIRFRKRSTVDSRLRRQNPMCQRHLYQTSKLVGRHSAYCLAVEFSILCLTDPSYMSLSAAKSFAVGRPKVRPVFENYKIFRQRPNLLVVVGDVRIYAIGLPLQFMIVKRFWRFASLPHVLHPA